MGFQDFVHRSRAGFRIKAAICAGLVAAADYTWFAHHAGWTAAVLNGLVLAGVLLCNTRVLAHRLAPALVLALAGLALAPVLAVNALGLVLFAALTVLLALLPRLGETDDATRLARDVLRHMLRAGRQFGDFTRLARIRRRRYRDPARWAGIAILCVVPMGLTAVFLALFTAANPLLDRVLGSVDWMAPLEGLSFRRVCFWIAAAAAFWSVLRPRYRQVLPSPARRFAAAGRASLVALLFDRRSVLWSLAAFNALFMVQNVMDATFLWSGRTLPDGLTYAQYAHRGAYPLIATALLAGGFVLTALKPGTAMERDRAIRRAVYLWLAQTVALVASSIVRLNGYVGEYELTYLRAAAFVWMGLVAVGLGLIVARIALGRSNRWLVNANALALAATLYAASFVSVGGIVASYNVRHCAEVNGTGPRLDLFYLRGIGEGALPAIIWIQDHQTGLDAGYLWAARQTFQRDLDAELSDWRQWTWRRAELGRIAGERP